MNRTAQKALYLILVCLGLGLIFNFLFLWKLVGISVFIFAVIFLGAIFLFDSQHQVALRKTWWLVLLIAFFALMPSIHANQFLNFLNGCAALVLLMFLANELTGGTPAFLMKVRDYFILAFMVPLQMLGRALSTLSLAGQARSNAGNVGGNDVWPRVFKGVIVAVPVLIVFGALFSQADLAFAQFVNGIFKINISGSTIQYLFFLGVAFVAALSFLSYIFFPKKTQTTILREQFNPIQSTRGVEVPVFLGLISGLFLLFIGFQVAYLFGGQANITNAGFTYAEYARRGFWELLVVAILSLLVLLVSERYVGMQTKKNKQFLIPALILIVEVIIIIISAFKRLSLYIDAYGMTGLRFYVAGFILLIAALFILLAFKFAKAKQENFFAFGTLLLVTAFLVVVNVISPDAFIAQANLDQFNRTGKIDVQYVGALSTDAEQQKIQLYNELQGNDKKVMQGVLQYEKESLQNSSVAWQSSNFSRSRALILLNELKD